MFKRIKTIWTKLFGPPYPEWWEASHYETRSHVSDIYGIMKSAFPEEMDKYPTQEAWRAHLKECAQSVLDSGKKRRGE